MSTGRATLLFVSMIAVLSAGCDAPQEAANDPARLARVRITATELLTGPAIGGARAYTPDRAVMLAGATGIQAVGFFITLSAGKTPAVKLRTTDILTGTTAALARIAPPGVAVAIEDAARALDEDARTLLVNGTGVFWLNAAPTDAGDLQQRLGVLIPRDALGARTNLEAFASVTSGGAPLGGDRIELARAFFYLTALGDSAMWGNGLREEDKFSTLVAREIERDLDVRVIRTVHAVSGATIAANDLDGLCTSNCSGEAPQFFTSIGLQAGAMERPELIDLILLDGCGNDINLDTVLSSTDNTEKITSLANEHCFGKMANLLIRVRALAPHAPIVVTGYFPFVSLDSDLSEVGTWAEANDIELESIEELTPRLTAFLDNSQVFQETTSTAITAAVKLVNDLSLDAPPIVFVDAEFGEENATFASDTWLWGLTDALPLAQQLGLTLDLFPEDPLLFARLDLCVNAEVAPAFLGCVYASIGHPNPAGARAYADGIVEALRAIGMLSATPELP